MDFGAILKAVSLSSDADLSRYDNSFLARSISRRFTATSVDDPDAYARYLVQNPTEVDELVSSLNVCYSVFFRNPLAMAVLENIVFPDLIERKVRSGEGIRVWSAGCAAGQEPYSISIVLQDLMRSTGKSFGYQIFATDISPSELAVAERGVYGLPDVMNVPLKHIRTYFSQQDGAFLIDQCLRAGISFSLYDLMDSASCSPPACIYGDFDVVICSNVLFYFNTATRHRILKKLISSLVSGGFLVVGEAERGLVEGVTALRPVDPCASVYQRRGSL